MITLSFTLYRFVCDVATFAGFFAPDEAGRCIPETASFACHWLGVPRAGTTLALESSGNTPSFFFKTHGNDMTLNFNNAIGSLLIDGATDVVAFRVMATSCAGDPTSIIAKGTLDPLQFLGKPAKNYAIKLRDTTGQIAGKLLFSLEVRDAEEGSKNKNGVSAPLLHNVEKPLHLVSSNERCQSPNGKADVADGRKSQEQKFQRSSGPSPPPSPPPLTARRECVENISDRQNTAIKASHFSSKFDVRQSTVVTSRLLEINIERIVVKSEGFDVDAPAPFLLGGLYHLKIRYCGTVSSTMKVECRDPKEIACSHCATFSEPCDISSERFRFSLWENNLQVAGFSLDPAKFRLVPGIKKEYAIPFLYYPTKQVVSLEVAVCRKEMTKEEQKLPLSELKVTRAGDAVNVDTTRTEGTTQQPSIPLTYEKPMSQNKVEEGKRFAGDYALERRLSNKAGQSHCDAALRLEGSDKSSCQLEKQRVSEVTNGDNAPRRSSSGDEQKICYVSNKEPLYMGSAETGRRTKNASGAQTFLDQIVNRDSRSFSATRQSVRGVELSRAALSHRRDLSKTGRGSGSGTSLQCSASGYYSALSQEEGGEKTFLNGSTDCSYQQHSMRRGSGPQNTLARGQRDDELFSKDVSRKRNGKLTSLGLLLSQGGACHSRRTSLLDEWMEWQGRRGTTRLSQAGSVRSEYSRDDSVDSILSRNRAASPRPTKSFAQWSEQRPYQPKSAQRSASRGSATPGIPPRPLR